MMYNPESASSSLPVTWYPSTPLDPLVSSWNAPTDDLKVPATPDPVLPTPRGEDQLVQGRKYRDSSGHTMGPPAIVVHPPQATDPTSDVADDRAYYPPSVAPPPQIVGNGTSNFVAQYHPYFDPSFQPPYPPPIPYGYPQPYPPPAAYPPNPYHYPPSVAPASSFFPEPSLMLSAEDLNTDTASSSSGRVRNAKGKRRAAFNPYRRLRQDRVSKPNENVTVFPTDDGYIIHVRTTGQPVDFKEESED